MQMLDYGLTLEFGQSNKYDGDSNNDKVSYSLKVIQPRSPSMLKIAE